MNVGGYLTHPTGTFIRSAGAKYKSLGETGRRHASFFRVNLSVAIMSIRLG
jgi:hypothetical protein